jgi:hypothetical protein
MMFNWQLGLFTFAVLFSLAALLIDSLIKVF